MRVTFYDEEQEPLGSFVLVNDRVEIGPDVPRDGLLFFKETLAEELLSVDENLEPGEPCTAISDPEGWMRGLLLQYSNYKCHAELEEDDDDDEEDDDEEDDDEEDDDMAEGEED